MLPDNCKSCTLRDANNNTYPISMSPTIPDRNKPEGGKYKSVQVTAKVLFGSVQAITRLKQEEKAARENKRI